MKLIFLTIAIGLLMPVSSLAQHFTGCAAQDAKPLSTQLPVVKTTRNPQMDYCVNKEAELAGKFFGISAAIIMYEDSVTELPNVCMSHTAEAAGGTDGTVAIGCNYLQNMYAYSGNFSIIPIVVSHQFGHILDLSLKATPSIGMYRELFADFLSGCYMAYRSKQTFTDINNNLRWVVRIGDYAAVGDPAHHGTPLQRTAAFKAGYLWYKEQIATGSAVAGADASTAARIYLNLPDLDKTDKLAGN